MRGRQLKKPGILILVVLFILSACDSGTESTAVSADEQLKVQIEAAIAATADLPQEFNIEVTQGNVTISGYLNCEDCGGMRTPGNIGTIQQSLGAIVRAVPGVRNVEFSLVTQNSE